jgi:adenylate cyclase
MRLCEIFGFKIHCEGNSTFPRIKKRSFVKLQKDNGASFLRLLNHSKGKSSEKELALLFLDIRNFTKLLTSHPNDNIVYSIRYLFSVFKNIAEDYEGKVIETAGDGMYIVFGLKDDIDKSVKSSVHAALEMNKQLLNFNNHVIAPLLGICLEMGIGLHKGTVAICTENIIRPGLLTVMGYPVNVAARLQAATKELNNNVVISEEAYGLLDEHLNATMKNIFLKGINNMFNVRLLGDPYNSLACRNDIG